MFLLILAVLYPCNGERVERALPEGNIRGTRVTKTLIDETTLTVDVYYGVKYGTAERWTEAAALLSTGEQREDHTDPLNTPYCPNTSTLNQTEDCLTLDLFIPSDFSGDNLIIYLPPNPSNLPYAPATFPVYDATILSGKLNAVFALVRSRQYLFGYLNYKDQVGNFGLSDQRVANDFMAKTFQILFGRAPTITLVGDYLGAEHVSYHLFDSTLVEINNFIMYGGAPVYRGPIDDISIYQNMCKMYWAGEGLDFEHFLSLIF